MSDNEEPITNSQQEESDKEAQEEQEDEELYINNHDLIGVDGIIRA